MDIGEVLSRAWQIIWKHKVLWIFGILAGCASGSGGGNSGSGFTYGSEDLPYQVERAVSQIQDWQWALIAGVIFLLILVLVVLAIFLSTIGKIGLIRGTVQAEKGQEKLAFGELFSGSMPYFWRVFLLNLLVGLAFALVIIAFFLIAVFGSVITLGIALICLIPLLCIIIPLFIVAGAAINVTIEQANNAIVIEELGIMDGLKRGWEVVKENAGTMVLMWLVLVLGISLIGGLIIGLPLMLTVGPIIAAVIAGGENAILGGVVVAAICFVIYLPFLIVLGGILRSYVGTAWTLTFMRLTATPEPPEVGETPKPLPTEPEPLPEAL